MSVIEVHDEGVREELDSIGQITRPCRFRLIEEDEKPPAKDQETQQSHVDGFTDEVKMYSVRYLKTRLDYKAD